MTYSLSVLSSLFLLNTHPVYFTQHSSSSNFLLNLSNFLVFFCLFVVFFFLKTRSSIRTEREREKDVFCLRQKRHSKCHFSISLSPSLLYVLRNTNVSFMDDDNDNNMTFYSRLFSTIVNAQTTRNLLKSSSPFFFSSFLYNVL